MGFFYIHKPRKYNYIPRYYNPCKEEWERKKAAAGLGSELSHEDKLRMQMRSRWSAPKNEESSTDRNIRIVKRIVVGVFIVLMIYFIFCTPLLNNLVAGMMSK